MSSGIHERTALLLDEAAGLFKPLASEPSPFGPSPGYPTASQQVPLAHFHNEATLTEGVLRRLEPWFHIEREISGKHPTGRPCRIDAVLKPRDAPAWKNPDVALGVEFKSWFPHVINSSRKDTTGWVAQTIDYSMTDWTGYGRLPIFMCPDPFMRSRDVTGMDATNQFVDGLLGKFNVGYMALFNGVGLTMLMHGNNTVWSERYGVSHGRKWTLRSRTGNRS
ncbi:hypothetical protein AB0O32_01290 [Streptomyces rubiginosohelvolus]|uniref:hypothetical protein n=1 Tax=Streptomyces rubiginosohelvolus TaxID=67362 RepID=UPI0034405681